MIPLKKLKSSSSGFIFDDSCIFGVEFIKVITVKTTDTISENLYVQQSNTFDDHGVYTWIIEDFTTPHTPCNSPTFVIGGYKWYLILNLQYLPGCFILLPCLHYPVLLSTDIAAIVLCIFFEHNSFLGIVLNALI
jgi:hypothetical protein